MRNVPDVRKAVRWNTPFYDIEGQDWFIVCDCTTNYVKVSFLNRASLRPLPPVEPKQQDILRNCKRCGTPLHLTPP